MKKIFYYVIAFLGIGSFYACEEEAKNPGNFDLKCELGLTGVTYQSNGGELPFNVLRTKDTTYVRFYEKPDTLKENGEFVLDEKGQYIVRKDTIYYEGKLTAKFVEIEPIILEYPADTILISLRSNAKWVAPMPSAGGKVQWFFTQRLGGGGDGTVIAAVTRNRNFKRNVDAIQYVMTSDSTILYKMTFNQRGEKGY